MPTQARLNKENLKSHNKPGHKHRDPNGRPTAPNTDGADPQSKHRQEDPDSPRNPGDLPEQKLSKT
jgi:hypothetical protein